MFDMNYIKSKVLEILKCLSYRELKEFGIDVDIYDPKI